MSQDERVRVAVVGCGYWGKNYLRIFERSRRAQLVAAVEPDPGRAAEVRAGSNGLACHADLAELLERGGLDAVVISTPASRHYEGVRQALDAGLHVLAEKPLAMTVAECADLVERAESRALTLMVGHTFLYNAAVQRMREIVRAGQLGEVYYLHANRTNLGPIRDDVSAMWDLAAHDVAIFNFLLDARPETVSAVGGRYLLPDREDVVFLTLTYPGGVLGHVHVSWINASKVRDVIVVGSRGRMVFDDLNNLEKVRLFEKGIGIQKSVEGFGEFQYLLRDGDIVSPKIDLVEPLRHECEQFLDAVIERRAPASDGRTGLAVVAVLAAAERSLRRGGAPVAVEAGA